MDTITIHGDEVSASTPEGVQKQMPLAKFIDEVRGQRGAVDELIFPDGVKHVHDQFPMLIVVSEASPAIRNIQWISETSRRNYGPGTSYKTYRMAMPYIIVFSVYAHVPGLGLRQTERNEGFFRRAPVKSLDDELLFPALLNCSRFDPVDKPGKSLSWICTQHLKKAHTLDRITDTTERIRRSQAALWEHFLYSAFNRSSEEHEGSSHYSATIKLVDDDRLSSPTRWQENTDKDPMFVLDFPFLKTGYSVRRLCERIVKNFNVPAATPKSFRDLARLVFNYQPEKKTRMAYQQALWTD